MGAAHRSTHGRAQAIEDRFETLRTRRLALSAETVGPRNLARSLARFDPHAYSTSAVTLLGAHCAPARERAGMWLMRLLQLDKNERVVDQGKWGHSIHHPPRPVSYRLTLLASRRHGAEPVTRTKPQIRILRRLRSGIKRLSSANAQRTNARAPRMARANPRVHSGNAASAIIVITVPLSLLDHAASHRR